MGTNSSLETHHTMQRLRRMTQPFSLSSKTMSPPPLTRCNRACLWASISVAESCCSVPPGFLVWSPGRNQKIKMTHSQRQGLTPPWKEQALPNNLCYVLIYGNRKLKNNKAFLHLSCQCARHISKNWIDQVLSEYFLVSEHRIMQCNSLSLLFLGQYLVVWTTVLILTPWAIISWSSLDCDP